MSTLKRFRRALLLVSVASVMMVASGCRKERGHDHAHHDHAHDHDHHGHDHGQLAEGAKFTEGRGIVLKPETAAAIGLKIEAVEEREFSFSRHVSAQVIQTTPEIRALAALPSHEAEHIRGREIPGTRLLSIDRHAEAATGRVDLVFALDAARDARVGDVIALSVPFMSDGPVVAVPTKAVLSTASGRFVYVVNGDALLRTPVEIGVRSEDVVEITGGLYAGDEVVVHPAEQLWLIELRATKGGGHSH